MPETVSAPPSGFVEVTAIELGVNSHLREFASETGTEQLLPTGPGLRIDSGIIQGDAIAAELDSMIAKLVAWAPTRREALGRLRCALAETVVLLKDGTTNQASLLDLLKRPEVLDGVGDTGWLDRLQVDGDSGSVVHADAALV